MTDQRVDDRISELLGSIRGARDAISVGRVFGEPWVCDGTWVIPVARVAGGVGGGGGEGVKEGESGNGLGTGFGLRAHPVGVYAVRGDQVTWRPALDATRLARGGQILAGVAIL